MQVDGMAERHGPEVTMVVFWPTKGRIDHHRASGTNSMLDSVLGYAIMMVAAHATMADTLTL
jgi:hypothetical protein